MPVMAHNHYVKYDFKVTEVRSILQYLDRNNIVELTVTDVVWLRSELKKILLKVQDTFSSAPNSGVHPP